MNHRLSFLSYPKISGIVHVNRHIASIDSLHTVDGDVLGFVFILISWLPKRFRGTICQTANHGRPAWSFYVNNAGQVLQAHYYAQFLPTTNINDYTTQMEISYDTKTDRK